MTQEGNTNTNTTEGLPRPIMQRQRTVFFIDIPGQVSSNFRNRLPELIIPLTQGEDETIELTDVSN